MYSYFVVKSKYTRIQGLLPYQKMIAVVSILRLGVVGDVSDEKKGVAEMSTIVRLERAPYLFIKDVLKVPPLSDARYLARTMSESAKFAFLPLIGRI